ncbi:MAG: restriction endonuclease subunit S [Microcystis flos-aquae TF09]|uniref:Restriction endonuclease subunit S n=1 Tax=Microcystis flos-aquae TF09 TaxID=2060473 RepID=A0A3E0L716_9CHRO|nr:MAG: restriction endonuclease subunit S [Microcystis flos-aquae TF09]
MTDSNSNYSDLPLGWKFQKLGDFAQYKKGKKPKNLQNKCSGEFIYPYVDIQAFEEGVINNYTDGIKCVFCDVDDLLMVWDGSRSGYVGKSIKGVLGSTLMKINFPTVNNNFAFYFLKSKYLEINSRAKGTGTPHVDPNLLWNYILPLPPLPEQHRIVEKIEELFSELDNGVASLKKALEQLKTYRQAVLKWAFEGKLTEKWRNTHQDSLEDADTLLEQIKAERKRHYQQQLEDWKQALKEWENNGKETKKPTKPQQPKDLPPLTKEELSNLPSLPNGWMWVKVDYLLSLDKKGMTTGPFGTLLKKSEHQISGIPVLGIENIGNGVFLPKNKIFITEKKARELSSFEVSGGDIIISRSGTVGEICLVPDYFGYSLISTNLIRISLNKTIISPKFFVFLFLGGGSVREQVKELCKGSTRDFLNQTILQSIIFPFPSLQEQTQIVQEIESRLSVCDQLEATLTENLDKAEALRQSILKRAFEGKLVL